MSQIKIIDGDGIARYYQTMQDGTITYPFQSVVPDYDLAWAENKIFQKYGHNVSIWESATDVINEGRNPDLDLGVRETIWETGNDEVLKTANTIDRIVSTAVGDGQQVVIEGFTISGTDLTFVSQTATLLGTTEVLLTTPLARVTRAYNDGITDFAGDISIKDDAVSTNLTIKGTLGENQSKKAQTAVSSTDYFIITELSAGVVGTAARVRFEFQVKEVGKVWRTFREWNSSTFTEIPSIVPFIVKPNSDIRIVGTSDTNNTTAVALFGGYLAKII